MKQLVWAILLSSSLISTTFAEMPNFMGLGDLAGGAFFSQANAVSADGMTVVGYSTSSSFNPAGGDEAFRWNLQTGQMLGLGALGPLNPALRTSRATGVNGDGSKIIGNAPSPDSFSQPFTWQNGTMSPALSDETVANQMATNGNWTATTSFGPWIDGMWMGAGSTVHIPIIPGSIATTSFRTNARAISSDGSTVVGQSAAQFQFPASSLRAYRWTLSGGSQPLGNLPGTNTCDPTAVSGDGSIIVGLCVNQRFRWTQATGMQPFVGGITAKAMSDDGSIMVSSDLIWDANNGIRILPDVMTMLGVDMTGWSFLDATDITPDGSVIVGSGLHNGQTEAFRAYIPEPMTVMLLLVASTFIRHRKSAV